MAYSDFCSRTVRAFLLIVLMFPFGMIDAATLTLKFGHSFGDTSDPDTAPPDGAGPWMEAFFDDGGTAGSVTLTLTVDGSVGIADVTAVYLNVDSAICDVNCDTNMSIIQLGGTDSADTIEWDEDGFKADSDGLYDILISFTNNTFSATDTSSFTITAAGLVAGSFNFLSTPDDVKGPFYGAAKFQSTGDGSQSDWVAAIPVPASAWLLGSALGLLGWIRRRAIGKNTAPGV